jgi:hypothetical protein
LRPRVALHQALFNVDAVAAILDQGQQGVVQRHGLDALERHRAAAQDGGSLEEARRRRIHAQHEGLDGRAATVAAALWQLP